jgi:spore maturation protein CgeB
VNILIIGNSAADSFGRHIADTLELMGHKVASFSFEPNTYEARNTLSKRINLIIRTMFYILMKSISFRNIYLGKAFRKIFNNSFDLIIVTHDYFYPNELKLVRKLSDAKLCLWYPDPISTMNRALFIGCDYDFIFLKEPFIVDKFRRLTDLNVFYLPECFNPYAYGDSDEVQYENEVELVTFGNFHPWRALLLDRLTVFKLKFYGVDPPLWLPPSRVTKCFTGFPVFNEQKKRAVLSSPIVINNMHFGEIWGASARIFEVAGLGGFQITESNIALEELYTPGEEIITYKSKGDLQGIVEKYLEDAPAREAIAMAGKRRTLNDHTYEKRLQLLIDTVFHDGSGYYSKHISQL